MDKNKITIDVPDLEKQLGRHTLSMSMAIAEGKTKDGKSYQIHVVITTEEDEFMEITEL